MDASKEHVLHAPMVAQLTADQEKREANFKQCIAKTAPSDNAPTENNNDA